MGLSGITSVIRNYLSVPKSSVEYTFLITAGIEDEVREQFSPRGTICVFPVSRLRHPLRYMHRLTAFLRKERFDVVHVHGNSGTMFFDIHAAKKAGVPIRIAHAHSSFCKYRMVHRLLKLRLNRELTHAVACSELAGAWCFTRDFVVLPNGINTADFAYNAEAREELRAALGVKDAFVVGHVANFELAKNHTFLLSFFATLLVRRPQARLLLVGDGALRPEIEAQIARLGIKDAVLLLGKRADVQRLYSAMDVFVLPSLYEGLPVTLIEAQTSGLPTCISEAVTRSAAVLESARYLPLDPAAWCDALEALALAEDREHAAARIAASSFGIENCVGRLYALYGAEER